MFELESKELKPIELIMNLFTANNIRFWYCYDYKEDVYTIQYEEIDSESILDELETIAIKYNL